MEPTKFAISFSKALTIYAERSATKRWNGWVWSIHSEIRGPRGAADRIAQSDPVEEEHYSTAEAACAAAIAFAREHFSEAEHFGEVP